MPRRLREPLLWAGSLLGVLCLGWTVVLAVAGLTPLVVLSGSMAPTIATGDLALARTVPAADLVPGDVVSVDSERGTRVTHRLLDVQPGPDGRRTLTLQGDANPVPDSEQYQVDAADRVVAVLPRMGYVLDAASRPWALLLAGGLVAACLIAGFSGDRPGREPDGEVAAGRHRAAAVALLAVPVLVLGAGAGAGPVPTAAAFSDGATVVSGSFGARTLPAPPNVLTCREDPLQTDIVVIGWLHVATGVDYVVRVRNTAGTVLSTQVVTGTGAVGAAQSVTLRRTDPEVGAGLWANRTVTVQTRMKGWTGWESAQSASRTFRDGFLFSYCQVL